MSKRRVRSAEFVEAGSVMLDPHGLEGVNDVVLRDRKRLSEEGIIIVTAGVDLEYECISIPPEVITRGFVYEKENEDLIGRITESARNSLIRNLAKGVDDINVLKTRLRDDIAEYARKRTKHKPMIVVNLTDIQL
jgi:ribonuclease J